MLVHRSWQEGYAAGLSKRAAVSFLLGIVIGAIATVSLLIGTAFGQTVPPAAARYKHDLTKIARSVWGLDAPISSLAAQLHQESAFRQDAVSFAGASGIAQFMRATAADMAQRYPELQPANVFDPRWAMRAQSLYMRELYTMFPEARNNCERAAFALASYNGGGKWTRKRQALSEDPSRCLGLTCEINPGIKASNQRENRDYSRRILLRLSPLYYEAQWGPAWCLSYVEGP
jgi:soluble lytic murein transglycosylase-like protein